MSCELRKSTQDQRMKTFMKKLDKLTESQLSFAG